MKKTIVLLTICCLVGCTQLSPVKSPSLTVTASDTTDDCYKVDMKAGRYGLIFYTLDGSVPTLRSEMYTGSLYVQSGTTIRSASFCPGGRRSEIVSIDIDSRTDRSSLIKAEYCSDITQDIQ